MGRHRQEEGRSTFIPNVSLNHHCPYSIMGELSSFSNYLNKKNEKLTGGISAFLILPTVPLPPMIYGGFFAFSMVNVVFQKPLSPSLSHSHLFDGTLWPWSTFSLVLHCYSLGYSWLPYRLPLFTTIDIYGIDNNLAQ